LVNKFETVPSIKLKKKKIKYIMTKDISHDSSYAPDVESGDTNNGMKRGHIRCRCCCDVRRYLLVLVIPMVGMMLVLFSVLVLENAASNAENNPNYD
jgi:hypothetical protein